VTGRTKSPDAARRLLIALGIVVAVLLVLVVVRYWPPWVADMGTQAVDWVVASGTRIWRHTGGRWVLLLVLLAVSCLALLLWRRSRIAGITLIEVTLAACALVALLQPDGW
jgi:hypothetical protein